MSEHGLGGRRQPYDRIMSVESDDKYYKRGGSRPGIALIITVSKCLVGNLSERIGARKDQELLQDLFTKLNFTVKPLHDPTKNEIFDEVYKVIHDPELGNIDCLVVAISTHGKTRVLQSVLSDCPSFKFEEAVDMLWAVDEPFDVREVLDLFRENWCPALKDKPKLFFLQGCRGKNVCETVRIHIPTNQRPAREQRSRDQFDTVDVLRYKEPTPQPILAVSTAEPMDVEISTTQGSATPPAGNDVRDGGPMVVDQETEIVTTHRCDIKQDYLAMWAAPPGYHAFHTADGSPFFRKLHDVLLEDHNTDDLLTMLTKVNRLVATTYESRTLAGRTNKRHIVPSISHMLRKQVSFSTN